jgi:hypothetical protein
MDSNVCRPIQDKKVIVTNTENKIFRFVLWGDLASAWNIEKGLLLAWPKSMDLPYLLLL